MASVTHMGVGPADHVVLYALRNIAGGFPGPTVDSEGTSAGLQEVIVRGYLAAARR